MVEIGGNWILWHIMKSIVTSALKNLSFVVVIKGYLIKEYFNYFLHTSDVTIDLAENQLSFIPEKEKIGRLH